MTKEVTQGVIRPAGKAVGAAAGELAKDENRAKVGCPAHLVHPHASPLKSLSVVRCPHQLTGTHSVSACCCMAVSAATCLPQVSPETAHCIAGGAVAGGQSAPPPVTVCKLAVGVSALAGAGAAGGAEPGRAGGADREGHHARRHPAGRQGVRRDRRAHDRAGVGRCMCSMLLLLCTSAHNAPIIRCGASVHECLCAAC